MLATFGVGQVLLSLIWFFLFFMWIMLLFNVFGDIFRDREMSGAAKVGWLLLVLVLPYLGVFIYLIARGPKMAHNQLQAMQAQEAAARAYIQDAAGSASPADQLARANELTAAGTISDEEYEALKAKILS